MNFRERAHRQLNPVKLRLPFPSISEAFEQKGIKMAWQFDDPFPIESIKTPMADSVMKSVEKLVEKSRTADPPPLTLDQLFATQRMLMASRDRYEANMRKWFRRNAVTSPFSAKHVAARGSIILHLDGKPIGTVKDVNFSDRPDAIAGELYTGDPAYFELSMVATTYAQEAIARYYRLREEEAAARARLRRHSGSLSRHTGPRRRQQLERLRADFKKLAADLDAIVEQRRQALRGGPKL